MALQKLSLVALLLTCAVAIRAQVPSSTPSNPSTRAHNLMPGPASLNFRPGRLAINNSFRVATQGFSDARLQAGIARALKRLAGRTGLTLNLNSATNEAEAPLLIQCQGAGQAVPSVA